MTPDEIQEYFKKGVELFRDKRFFDSHEELEEYWNHQEGAERLFTQGLIQATVACHHLQNGNVRGAVSLYKAGRSKLEPHAPSFFGLRVDLLLKQMDALFGPLEPEDDPPEEIPADAWPRPTWLEEEPLGGQGS